MAQAKAWLHHLHYVASVWDWGQIWVRRMRRDMFTATIRPATLDHLNEMRETRAMCVSRLHSLENFDEETTSRLSIHITHLGDILSVSNSLLDAIDALPDDGQAMIDETKELEQRHPERVRQDQNATDLLKQLGPPTVAQRIRCLEVVLADAAAQQRSRTKCESCKRMQCRCSPQYRKLHAEMAKELAKKAEDEDAEARKPGAWRTPERVEAVESRLRERATARKRWVSLAEKIVC
ncbi:hypothetical protein LTR85_007343 [Meristemomyces frigidus]|nr:hypothetical protein LTR85_007343 [Meristemomyces frigidus]